MPTVRPLTGHWPPVTARLPIDPDEGFPQAFRFTFAGRTYRVGMYAAVSEQQLDPRATDPRIQIDITGANRAASITGLLIADVVRESGGRDTTLLHRRLLPGLSYGLAELRLDVVSASVAVGNLNGHGRFGSHLDLRVGAA